MNIRGFIWLDLMKILRIKMRVVRNQRGGKLFTLFKGLKSQKCKESGRSVEERSLIEIKELVYLCKKVLGPDKTTHTCDSQNSLNPGEQ